MALLMSVSSFNLAFAQPTQASFTVSLNWFSLQVAYPAEVMPGDTVSVSVQAIPKSSSVYLQNLTATVYYADATGLHLIATETLANSSMNGYGFYGTGSFNTTFTVSVPQSAPRTSLFAVFSETVKLSYYALYYSYAPYYGYGWYPNLRYGFYPHYSFETRTDDAVAPLSYIEATTPEYVSLQSAYQTLQRQLNETQSKESQLQSTIVEENATINQLNQQLASVKASVYGMTETYQLLVLGLGILSLVFAAISIYEWRAKEKTRKTPETSTLGHATT
jgi:hypothetical protein